MSKLYNLAVDFLGAVAVRSTLFSIKDTTDPTKVFQVDQSLQPTATTKALAIPASSTGKFLKDDFTWATPAGGGGGGDVYLANSQTFTALNIFNAEVDFHDQTWAMSGSLGFHLFDDLDDTKSASWNTNGFTTGMNRVFSLPDADGMVITDTATQTLSNKTLGTSNTVSLKDTLLSLNNAADGSKTGKFDLGGLTTAAAQTWYMPDATGFLAMAPYYGILTSNYTLTSSTSTQKLFNFGSGSGGALTLPVGYYTFECMMLVTGMSATSGNLQFDLKGAGSATLASIGLVAIGADSSTPTTTVAASSGGGAVTATTAASLASAGTGTGIWALVRGTFRVTAAGTIVPSVKLVTASAAVVNAGSYFSAQFMGAGNLVGTWT